MPTPQRESIARIVQRSPHVRASLAIVRHERAPCAYPEVANHVGTNAETFGEVAKRDGYV
jgi:hypothetical protein